MNVKNFEKFGKGVNIGIGCNNYVTSNLIVDDINSRIFGNKITFTCNINPNNIRYFNCKVHDCINNTSSNIKIPFDVFNNSSAYLPKHIYVTNKATVFQYDSKDDKLILYRKEEDSMDVASAFMWAYTMRCLKISKIQMHKLMDSLENSVKIEKPKKKKKQ